MIKTPVHYRDDSENMYDRKGGFLAHISKQDIAADMQKRINMHDELVLMLKDIALVDGGSECIKSKIARARELLEKCK